MPSSAQASCSLFPECLAFSVNLVQILAHETDGTVGGLFRNGLSHGLGSGSRLARVAFALLSLSLYIGVFLRSPLGKSDNADHGGATLVTRPNSAGSWVPFYLPHRVLNYNLAVSVIRYAPGPAPAPGQRRSGRGFESRLTSASCSVRAKRGEGILSKRQPDVGSSEPSSGERGSTRDRTSELKTSYRVFFLPVARAMA